MKVALDNFYCFKNTTVDFTYPRKLVASSLDNEFFEERPNFRFKRVCILAGGNASGKTAFGRMLYTIQNIISGRPTAMLPGAISNKAQKASFSVDFVTTTDLILHRLTIIYGSEGVLEEEYLNIPIGQSDSYEKTSKKLDMVKAGKKLQNSTYHHHKERKSTFSSILAIDGKIPVDASWYYVFNGDHMKTSDQPPKDSSLLEKILQTFDPSVKKVKSLGNGDHRIEFKNKDTVLIDKVGDIAGRSRLSLGTLEAIGTTLFVEAVMQSEKSARIFYLDESMAYAHSELEKTIINLIISKLSPLSQLFVTTHNYDILDMNLPIHSYMFLKKKDTVTTFIKPELEFKKNDRSLINYIHNDVFGTTPDTLQLDGLL